MVVHCTRVTPDYGARSHDLGINDCVHYRCYEVYKERMDMMFYLLQNLLSKEEKRITKSKFGLSSTTTIYKETNYVMSLLTYSVVPQNS